MDETLEMGNSKHSVRTGRRHVFRLRSDVEIDFHCLLDNEHALDDTAILLTDDDGPGYEQKHLLSSSRNVTKLEDGFVRVKFTDILAGRPYSLVIDPGVGADGEKLEPYCLFSRVILPTTSPEEPTQASDVDYSGGEEICIDPLPEDEDPRLENPGLGIIEAGGMPPLEGEPEGVLWEEEIAPYEE
jgi:hypothetical protein